MTINEKSNLQKKITDSLPLKPHGILYLSPRIGKTKIAIDIVKKNKPKSILWVTPSNELAKKDIPEEFIKWKAKKYIKKLITVTWMSLNKITGHYDMIILDENQMTTENNIVGILNNNITYNYILAMTGTETKHESKKDIYKLLKLPVLYKLSINEAVNIGMLANYTIKVLQIDLGKEKNVIAGKKEKQFLTTEESYYKYISNNADKAVFNNSPTMMYNILARMRFIQNSKSKNDVAKYLIYNLQGRKLFFCSSINQAKELCVNNYHSKTDNKDLIRFTNGEIDTITMVNAGGIGFTYKEIDHLVITQCDSDKNGNNSQKICRTLLEQPNYKATIWILCLIGTKDEKWVESALENFDKTKIEYIKYKNFKL